MTLQIEPKTSGAVAAGEDPVAELRRLHASVIGQQTEDFPVPGYGGRLVVRYKVLDPDAYREILNAGDMSTEDRHAQFLIRACDEILYRWNDGTVKRINPDVKVTFSADPLNPGETLDQVLGLPAQMNVADTVLGLFGGKWGAMNKHAVTVDRWMTSVFDLADEAVVGGQPVTQ